MDRGSRDWGSMKWDTIEQGLGNYYGKIYLVTRLHRYYSLDLKERKLKTIKFQIWGLRYPVKITLSRIKLKNKKKKKNCFKMTL